VVIAGFVWPRRSYVDTTAIPEGSSSVDEPTTIELLHKSLKDVRSLHFVYLSLFVAFLVFKSNFFLSTYNDQFALHLSAAQVSKYNTVFGVLLPGIGMLAGPIGIFFDKFGVNAALVLVVLLSTTSSVCGMLVYSTGIFGASQIVRMLVFSIYYPMIYGVWAFAIINKYGTSNFGVLYGIIAILAGILNILASDPVNQHALKVNSYVHVNFFFAVVGFLFIFYPLISGLNGYYWKRKRSSYQAIGNVQ